MNSYEFFENIFRVCNFKFAFMKKCLPVLCIKSNWSWHFLLSSFTLCHFIWNLELDQGLFHKILLKYQFKFLYIFIYFVFVSVDIVIILRIKIMNGCFINFSLFFPVFLRLQRINILVCPVLIKEFLLHTNCRSHVELRV